MVRSDSALRFVCLTLSLVLLATAASLASPEERLAAALRFRTVSHQEAPPDAEAFLGLHRFLRDSFPRVHATLEREVVADYSLLYRWPGRDRSLAPLLLTAHLDVVPVPNASLDAWEHAPFEGAIAEGFVWGRGALDDKVGLLGILEAVEQLLARGFVPRRTVLLAFGHDEELGGEVGAGAITQRLESDGVRLWATLDEGMVILESGLPGLLDRPLALIGIAEKGFLTLRLTAHAEGGHSSMPPPSGAIGRLARAVLALEAHPQPIRTGGVWDATVAALAPHLSWSRRLLLTTWPFTVLARSRLTRDPALNASVRTTTAVTMAGAGTKTNVLPTEAWAIANFRIVPGDTSGAVVERVREAIDDPGIEIEVLRATEASRSSDPRSESYRKLEETVHATLPDTVVAPALVLGGTDSKHYGRLAENSYRFTPIRLGSKDRSRVHGVNERIGVDVYRDAIRFYEAFLERATGG